MSIIDKSDIQKTLRILSPAIDKNPNILGSNCVAFSNKKAYAFNEWLGIVIDTPYEIEATIEATNLPMLLGNYVSNEVEVEKTGNQVQFKIGRGKFSLPMTDVPLLSRFHSIIPCETWFKCIPPVFTKGLNLCTIQNGPVTGIYINGSDMLSCRTGICRFTFDGQVEKFRISNKAAQVVASHNVKELMVLPTWVIFRTEACDLYVRRLYDEDYPSSSFLMFTDGVAEGNTLCSFEFHPHLLSVLETAITMQDSHLDKVSMTFTDNEIAVSVNGRGGMFNDAVDVECTLHTDTLVVDVNVVALMPILKKGITEVCIIEYDNSLVMKLCVDDSFAYYEKIK